VFLNVTMTNSASAPPVLYRNPLPMSDGQLIAAVTPATNVGINLGTDTAPRANYQFRLMLLTNSGPGAFYFTNQFLTSAPLTNPVTYRVGSTIVTQSFALWELQPVEIRARANPGAWNPGVAGIEQSVFTSENVDLATFQADLAQRGLAL